jgi:hypothetical protein
MARTARKSFGPFLLGSDTWINERWDSYDTIVKRYRAWLAQMPADQAQMPRARQRRAAACGAGRIISGYLRRRLPLSSDFLLSESCFCQSNFFCMSEWFHIVVLIDRHCIEA